MNDNSFSTIQTTGTNATASTPVLPNPSSSNSPTFKPTSLIPKVPTFAKGQVEFCNNVMSLAQFYEEHEHFSVPRSNKKLFQFCKNMKTAIRKRREGTIDSERRLSESQYKILRDIRFVGYISYLDKNKRQPPITKAYRNILVNIDSFCEQNDHTNIMAPDAKLIKTSTSSNGTSKDTDITKSLRDALRLLKAGKVGRDRKQTLKKKGVDLDAIAISGSSEEREEDNEEREEDNEENVIGRDDEVPNVEDGMVQVQVQVQDVQQVSPISTGRRESLQLSSTHEVRDSLEEESNAKARRHEDEVLGIVSASSEEKETEEVEEIEQQVALVNEGNEGINQNEGNKENVGNTLEEKEVESTANKKKNKKAKAKKSTKQAKGKKRCASSKDKPETEVIAQALRRSNRKRTKM